MERPLAPPVISALDDFDHGSGSKVEQLLFNHRPLILILCAIVTLFLGFEATRVQLSANYLQTIPQRHPFIVNYLQHLEKLSIQSNAIRIAVVADNGTILNAHYLQVLQEINDKVYLLPGVNRPFMKSLWTANTQHAGRHGPAAGFGQFPTACAAVCTAAHLRGRGKKRFSKSRIRF